MNSKLDDTGQHTIGTAHQRSLTCGSEVVRYRDKADGVICTARYKEIGCRIESNSCWRKLVCLEDGE